MLGSLLLLPVLGIGAMSVAIWLVCPIVGLPYYFFSSPHNKKYFDKLIIEFKKNPHSGVHALALSPAGKFFLSHLNISEQQLDLVTQADSIELSSVLALEPLINQIINKNIWPISSLHKLGIHPQDMILSAKWWDEKTQKQSDDHPGKYAQPGIGLELLFGYTPILNKMGTDLSISHTFKHHLIAREDLVQRMSQIISNGKGVVLHGEPGVGKKTVVLELAQRAMSGDLSPDMLYKRVIELDYNTLLSQSMDLNQKKVLLSNILTEAMSAGNIILCIKDIHRLTSMDTEGMDLTDVFENALDSHKLLLIAIESDSDYERFIATNTRLRKYMEPIEVVPTSEKQALDILMEYSMWWETQKKITITTPSIRATIDDAQKYISDTPFPEKALEVMDNAVAKCVEKGKNIVTLEEIGEVVAQTTGISLANLSDEKKNILADLENEMHKRLIGQDSAVSSIAKTLRSRALGMKSEDRPLGSFLFLGPTGVGKTEAAKTLARVYYGSEQTMIRFDMAEYVGSDGVEKLIGSVSQNRPGKLSTEIKSHPAALLLLDEIEKAPPEIYNIFLSVLDEGSFTDAYGRKINCKHLFIIATSNAGSEFIREQVTANRSGDDLQKSVIRNIQEKGFFSPEFLNRFDGVIVFEPLSPQQTIEIANLLLQDIVQKLTAQDISLTVTPQLAQAVAELGFEPEFGARPIRRILDLEVGDTIGKALLSKQIVAGDKIEIVPLPDKTFSIKKV